MSLAARRRFAKEGFCLFDHAIGAPDVEVLREECQVLLRETKRKMRDSGNRISGINHWGKRYFISKRHADRPQLRNFLFGPSMAALCRELLGDDVWLFNEQFVVKEPHVGMPFAWHQDSGYVDSVCPHTPYLSLWCPLDEVDETNGTIYVLPFSRANQTTRVEHRTQAGSNDLVGYWGADPGEPLLLRPGDVAAFSSVSFHRSTPNTGKEPRRIFLAQYSSAPIIDPRTQEPWSLAIPFLRDGRRIER